MLNVSSGFKSSVKQLVVVSDGKVDIVNSNRILSFNSDSLSKIELYGSAFQNDKVLGNLAQHSLTIEILGDLTKDISLNLENVVKPYIGVKVGSSFEYVQYQDFLITEITYSDTTNITKILATDSLVKLNKEYTDTNIYPITLKAYLESVLNSCGLSLENTTFFNDDFLLTEQKIANLTLARDIVSKVAELALCFVSINKISNKVQLLKAFDPFTRGYTHDELSAFTHSELANFTHYELAHAVSLQDETVDKSNYWNFKLSDHWFGKFGINTLTLKVSQIEGENNTVQDPIYVAADGAIELSIVDNPFINTEALRLSVIDAMFNEVKNYKYYPYSLEYIGFPYLELGDIVDIVRMDNAIFGSPIYEMTLRYDGGLLGKLNAKALSQTQTKFYNTQTVSQRAKNAEIIVDKVQGEVTIMAGDYYNGKLEGAKYVFDGYNATFYGGGLKIKNNALEDVFYADVNGNLTLTGKLTGSSITGSTFIAGSDGNRFEFDANSLRAYYNNFNRIKLDYDSFTFYTESGSPVAYMKATSSLSVGYENFLISTSNTYDADARINLNEGTWGNSKNVVMSVRNSSYVNANVNAYYDDYNMASAGLNASNNSNRYATVSVASNGVSSMYSSTDAGIRASIGTYAEFGTIQLDSRTESYSIYIGGAYRTIYRDANGFLKC